MSLEDRLRSTVDQAVAPLVKQLLEDAVADRDAALQAAREAMFQEVEQATQTRVADAEARMRSDMDQKLADTHAKAAEELKTAVSDARARESELERSGVVRLVEGVRGLDGATSLSEVLDALSLASAREAARAAVLVLRGDRIQGWRMSGFGSLDTQPKAIDLALGESGVVGLAVAAARPISTRDGQAPGPGFEELPADAVGMAVPVIVSGRVIAVVYADSVSSSNRHVPTSWPELIEVLARHAGRCLEALASQKAATKTPPASGTTSTNGPAQTPGSPVGNPPSAMMQITDGVQSAVWQTARLLVAKIRLLNESGDDPALLGNVV